MEEKKKKEKKKETKTNQTNNNDKEENKEEIINKAEKDQNLQSLLKDMKGVGEQAEMHGDNYTPPGQKYCQGDLDLSRGYWSPRNSGPFPFCKQGTDRRATLYHSLHQTPRMANRKCLLGSR